MVALAMLDPQLVRVLVLNRMEQPGLERKRLHVQALEAPKPPKAQEPLVLLKFPVQLLKPPVTHTGLLSLAFSY